MDTITVLDTSSPKARMLIGRQKPDDVYTVEDIDCIANVRIEDAHFKDMRIDASCFPIPYMEIFGEITDFFIEDKPENADVYFPCNTKRMNYEKPKRVKFLYAITTEEFALLVQRGLGHPGFNVPANLVGNSMELPVRIDFTGIYDTYICNVDVKTPMMLATSTAAAGYENIFKYCDFHKDILEEQKSGISFNEAFISSLCGRAADSLGHRASSSLKTMPHDTVTFEDGFTEPTQEENPVQADDVSREIAKEAQIISRKKEQSDSFDVSGILSNVARKKQDDSADDSIFINENDKEDNNQPLDYMSMRDGLREYEMTEAEKEKAAEKSGKKASEIMKNVDVAMDNQALNEGKDDIAGYGNDGLFDESPSDGDSPDF